MMKMPISVGTLRLQLDHSSWATQRLLDVAAMLSPEELTRDFQTADRCVLDTLARAMGHTPPPLDLMEYYMTL